MKRSAKNPESSGMPTLPESSVKLTETPGSRVESLQLWKKRFIKKVNFSVIKLNRATEAEVDDSTFIAVLSSIERLAPITP